MKIPLGLIARLITAWAKWRRKRKAKKDAKMLMDELQNKVIRRDDTR